jgi:hypothetical protein
MVMITFAKKKCRMQHYFLKDEVSVPCGLGEITRSAFVSYPGISRALEYLFIAGRREMVYDMIFVFLVDGRSRLPGARLPTAWGRRRYPSNSSKSAETLASEEKNESVQAEVCKKTPSPSPFFCWR